ncbi:MAG: class F sortase [Patescibacteria group bacterium]
MLKNKIIIIAATFLFFGSIYSFAFAENYTALLALNTNSFYEHKSIVTQAHLKIPRLNINAVIENTGIMSDGSMGTPKGPDGIAWFSLGVYPGDIGSAVMDGHSGWKNGRPAVFDNLYKLKKGDKIYFENGKGMTTIFIVRELRFFNPNENVPGVFISNDNLAHLNMITCAGDWNLVTKSHSKRLVVFTDKVI